MDDVPGSLRACHPSSAISIGTYHLFPNAICNGVATSATRTWLVRSSTYFLDFLPDATLDIPATGPRLAPLAAHKTSRLFVPSGSPIRLAYFTCKNLCPVTEFGLNIG